MTTNIMFRQSTSRGSSFDFSDSHRDDITTLIEIAEAAITLAERSGASFVDVMTIRKFLDSVKC